MYVSGIVSCILINKQLNTLASNKILSIDILYLTERNDGLSSGLVFHPGWAESQQNEHSYSALIDELLDIASYSIRDLRDIVC